MNTRKYFIVWMAWIVCLVIFCLGTFYFELWEIPGLNLGSDDETLGELRKIPLPLQCDDEKWTMGKKRPKESFCEWGSTRQPCHDMLVHELRGKKSWVFLGDTGMATIADFISKKWPYDPYNSTTYRNSCQNLAYYGLPPSKHGWVSPNISLGEGPIGRGVESPYCTDCTRGCWNVLMDVPSSSDNYVEYLVVEYSRDVSMQTQVTTTTQETVAYYLKTKSPEVCIASTGLNDAAIDPLISDEVYLQNSEKYLGLLQRVCKNVVWITIPAIVESAGVRQENCRLKRWNEKVLDSIESRNYKNVYSIDIWEKSMVTDHVGALVLEEKYYYGLARYFSSLMAAPALSR